MNAKIRGQMLKDRETIFSHNIALPNQALQCLKSRDSEKGARQLGFFLVPNWVCYTFHGGCNIPKHCAWHHHPNPLVALPGVLILEVNLVIWQMQFNTIHWT